MRGFLAFVVLPKVSVKGNERADRYTGGKHNPRKWYGFCGRKATSNSNHRLSEVDVLGSPSLISSPYGFCGRKATSNSNRHISELRSCVEVEADVLGVPNSPYGLCGHKKKLKTDRFDPVRAAPNSGTMTKNVRDLHEHTLQALGYRVLSPTTAISSYAIVLGKLSARMCFCFVLLLLIAVLVFVCLLAVNL